MIDTEVLFNEMGNAIGISVPAGLDDGDLVHVAEMVIERAITTISAQPESVGALWTWLEDKPVKIIARFDADCDMSKLSMDINAVFKKGADGAQLSIPRGKFDRVINDMLAVRDDLFFNKDLQVRVNLNDVEPNGWSDLFSLVDKIRATALVFDVRKKKRDDFVGRVYALLESVPRDLGSDLYFVLENDYEKMEQAARLFDKMRPDFNGRLKFFVSA